MANDETPPIETANADNDSLETLEGSPVAPASGASHETPAKPPARPPRRRWRLPGLFARFNIYTLIFGVIILVAAAVIGAAYLQNQHSNKSSQLPSQGLSQSALQQLANSDVTVGSNQTVLNVQSSAVFAGQVLIRQGLQVAGNLQLGGTLGLSSLTVAGNSQLGQAAVSRDLSVGGDTAIQGAETVGKSLQVSGNATFSGPLSAPQITTGSLNLSGDLTLSHHLTTSGGTPSRSNGSALGSGGTASVSGSDTAGSITINTGSNPPAGCFVTISFTSAFSSTPHVIVTPIGSAAGGLAYYVNRSSTSFSVCDATTPLGGASFGFDYFVAD